jgi:ubiquinone/menaquinone biosynthesis C-methylase UbiE
LHLFGLDYSSNAIARARAKVPGARFIVANMYRTGLPSDHFDIVLSIETLEHVRQPEQAVRELLRICRPGGKVVVTVPNGERDRWEGHVNFWTPSQFPELLSPFGHTVVNVLETAGNLEAVVTKAAP